MHIQRIVKDSDESVFIEGILHKKGHALFYTTWSLRYFELDVRRQKLKWYRCKPGGKKGVLRGEISLAKASACIKTAKQSSTNQIGHLIALNYMPMNSSDAVEMTLLSSTLEEAYQWIAHTNKSGSYYDVASPGITIQNEEEDRSELPDKRRIIAPAPLLPDTETIAAIEREGGAKAEVCNEISQTTGENSVSSNETSSARILFVFGKRIVSEMWHGGFDLALLLAPLGPLLLPVEYHLAVYISLMYVVLFLFCIP